MNCAMLVPFQSRPKNISVLRQPTKPSQAALSGEHPCRDIDRMSRASLIIDSQPGHDSGRPGPNG